MLKCVCDCVPYWHGDSEKWKQRNSFHDSSLTQAQHVAHKPKPMDEWVFDKFKWNQNDHFPYLHWRSKTHIFPQWAQRFNKSETIFFVLYVRPCVRQRNFDVCFVSRARDIAKRMHDANTHTKSMTRHESAWCCAQPMRSGLMAETKRKKQSRATF